MSKGTTLKTPHTVAPADTQYILKRNIKGEIPYFWTWYDSVLNRAQGLFPAIHTELVIAPLVETEAAALMRRLDGIPQLPLENERSKVLKNAAYAVVMTLPAAQRPREMELAIEEMQVQRRADNIAIAALNADRRLVYENRVARDLAKVTDRPKMTAWLLSEECLSPAALNEVKADGLYTAAGLSAHVALEIIRRVLGGVSAANRKLKSLYLTDLRALRQDTLPTHLYANKFKLAYRKCQSTGTVITEADLIDMFIFNLNLSVFELFIRLATG